MCPTACDRRASAEAAEQLDASKCAFHLSLAAASHVTARVGWEAKKFTLSKTRLTHISLRRRQSKYRNETTEHGTRLIVDISKPSI